MSEEKDSLHLATYQAIESTMPILGESWMKYWSQVLKPEIIQNFIIWLAGKQDNKDEEQASNNE